MAACDRWATQTAVIDVNIEVTVSPRGGGGGLQGVGDFKGAGGTILVGSAESALHICSTSSYCILEWVSLS